MGIIGGSRQEIVKHMAQAFTWIDGPAAAAIDEHAGADARSVPSPGHRAPRRVDLVILDLDHTVFDWTADWCREVRTLVASLAASGVAPSATYTALRAVHVDRGTMDAATAIADLRAAMAGRTRRADWIRAARLARRAALPLGVPGVSRTLARLAREGCRLVGYTESPAAAAWWRLGRAGVAEAFARVVSTRPAEPAGGVETLARWPPPRRAPIACVPWWPKGSRAALAELVAELGGSPARTCVVGDHLDKDVAPAAALGAVAVWARYGTRRRARDQRLVDRLCHWHTPPPDTTAGAVIGPHVAIDRFDALVDVIAPARFARSA
jgi:FMN phosphatase YigB (HAD superfamily)